MDYIREFDIRLEKEMYYAGELLSGTVILNTVENFKLRAIRVNLRGRAHTEWKVIISGDRRTVKDDQYYIDDRSVIWGKEKAEGSVPILPRGTHQFPFRFQLPETSLPCSFESKCGTIRYYLKVTIDIPYASPPQGIKYFTIIGPHIDCMDDGYLKPIRGESKRKICCLCCERRLVSLVTQLDRSAYCCGESLRVKADIDNQCEEEARLKLKLVQHVEYFIDRGVLGVEKEITQTILEYRSAPVKPGVRTKWDSQQSLVVSTMPPTLVGICRLIQIYYVLKVHLEFEKSGEDLHMNFPITIGTVPFRIPNSTQKPKIQYEVASEHAEGGMYIGPEFQLGQVYDGTAECGESIVLYRPVYITVIPQSTSSSSGSAAPQPSKSSSSLKKSSQKNSLTQKPSTSSSVKESHQGGSVKKPAERTESKTSRSSAKVKEVQKLNALNVAPPSLQSIAKKRSSLPENTKTLSFDFSRPLMKLENSISFRSKEPRNAESGGKAGDVEGSKRKDSDVQIPSTSRQLQETMKKLGDGDSLEIEKEKPSSRKTSFDIANNKKETIKEEESENDKKDEKRDDNDKSEHDPA